jgi:hypothetical protein
MTDDVECAVCHEPVERDEAHNPHEADCPARRHLRAVCECDIWVHPECCPECIRWCQRPN